MCLNVVYHVSVPKQLGFFSLFQPLSKSHTEYFKHLIINGCKFLDVEEEWFLYHFKLFYACILCIQCLLLYPMTHASSFVQVPYRYFIISFMKTFKISFKDAAKYLIRCLSRESKGSSNQLWMIINELNGFDLSPSWMTFQQKSEQSLNFRWLLKLPLYWGRQITEGDQTWFVEQMLNVELDLASTMQKNALQIRIVFSVLKRPNCLKILNLDLGIELVYILI